MDGHWNGEQEWSLASSGEGRMDKPFIVLCFFVPEKVTLCHHDLCTYFHIGVYVTVCTNTCKCVYMYFYSYVGRYTPPCHTMYYWTLGRPALVLDLSPTHSTYQSGFSSVAMQRQDWIIAQVPSKPVMYLKLLSFCLIFFFYLLVLLPSPESYRIPV